MFEIGTSLREARLRQGLEFPQLESATKIRGKYLRALEDEQFDELPAQTYVKGFLRTYADFLGLDGQLYVDEFNSRYGVEADEPPIRARRAVHAQRRVQTNVVIAALVGIAVVTALVIVAWTAGSPDDQNLPGVATTAAPRKRAATPPSLPNAPASITLRAVRAPVFLLVRKNSPNGKVLFNESLDAGDAEHFTVRRLWVNTGTPENLRVLIGGTRMRLPGGRPQVFYVTRRGISTG
jgi:cytoskeleton protein RodZ